MALIQLAPEFCNFCTCLRYVCANPLETNSNFECGAHAVLQGSDFFGYFEKLCYLGVFNDFGGSQNPAWLKNDTLNDSLRIMKDNAKLYIDGYFDFELKLLDEVLLTSCGVEEIILRDHPYSTSSL